jgi:hypothetical protein
MPHVSLLTEQVLWVDEDNDTRRQRVYLKF